MPLLSKDIRWRLCKSHQSVKVDGYSEHKAAEISLLGGHGGGRKGLGDKTSRLSQGKDGRGARGVYKPAGFLWGSILSALPAGVILEI